MRKTKIICTLGPATEKSDMLRQLIAKGIPRRRIGKISALLAPSHDGIYHAPDQLPHRSFALGRPGLAMEIFAGDNVGGRLRPDLGHFHVFLAEDRHPFFVPD